MELFSVPVALFVVILALIYRYATRNFSYWKDRGVTFVKPYPLVGSLFNILAQKEHMGAFFCRVAKENKGKPYVGYFQVKAEHNDVTNYGNKSDLLNLERHSWINCYGS